MSEWTIDQNPDTFFQEFDDPDVLRRNHTDFLHFKSITEDLENRVVRYKSSILGKLTL